MEKFPRTPLHTCT